MIFFIHWYIFKQLWQRGLLDESAGVVTKERAPQATRVAAVEYMKRV